MDFDFKVDTSLLTSITKGQLKKQGQFALANTLTSIAFAARKSTQQALPHWLKLTKRFIPSSVVVDKADKQSMTATVGFLKRVKLIDLMEYGGVRKPHSRTLAIPYNVKRSGRGGITAAKRPKRQLARKNVFSGTVKGVPGVWERSGSKRAGYKLKLLYAYEQKAKYKKDTVDFEGTVEKVFKRRISKTLNAQLERAIRTMKR